MRLVSYWSGSLPSVSLLHFQSFLARTSSSHYDLFLENFDANDLNHNQILDLIENNPRFTIHWDPWEKLLPIEIQPGLTLDELINRPTSLSALGSLCRRYLGVACKNLKIEKVLGFRGSYASVGGWDFEPKSELFNWHRWHTYRADIFRVIVPSLFPTEDVMWVDLDTCFIRDFSEWPLESSFVYRWEDQPFANNAVIFNSRKTNLSDKIYENARATGNYRPWRLFTNTIAEKMGLAILPPMRFDPVWDETSLMRHSPALFMNASENSPAIVMQIERENLLVHWHNQWSTIPDSTSPWGLLLNRMSV